MDPEGFRYLDGEAMTTIPVKRPLHDEEKALLDFLLSAEFPGHQELKAQAEHVEVVGECKCGCGTIDLQVEPHSLRANTEKHIPIEAYGEALDVLLFAQNGILGMLEIVYYAEPPERPYPRPDQLKLWARPPLPPKDVSSI
jgi:hypothetical protein